MKKLIFTVVGIGCFSVMSFAQIAPSPVTPPAKTEMSKEEKKAMKERQASDMQEALKGAGLTGEEITKANEILDEAGKKSKELKANDKLTDEVKDVMKKAINEDKNGKLKALMGEDRYKLYTSIRKKQKEAVPAEKAPQ